MNKLMMAVAGVLLATPALAGPWDGKRTDDFVETRVEYTWNAAKVICPTASRAANGDAMVRVVDSMATRAGLDEDEKMLLANYCLMYLQGQAAERDKRLSRT